VKGEIQGNGSEYNFLETVEEAGTSVKPWIFFWGGGFGWYHGHVTDSSS
jgi:hypothetical protein